MNKNLVKTYKDWFEFNIGASKVHPFQFYLWRSEVRLLLEKRLLNES